MRVNISPDIQANNILLGLVAAANGVVESELGLASALVGIDWKIVQDSAGRPRLQLSVRDGGRCEETFTLLDFYDFEEFRSRLRDCRKRFPDGAPA